MSMIKLNCQRKISSRHVQIIVTKFRRPECIWNVIKNFLNVNMEEYVIDIKNNCCIGQDYYILVDPVLLCRTMSTQQPHCKNCYFTSRFFRQRLQLSVVSKWPGVRLLRYNEIASYNFRKSWHFNFYTSIKTAIRFDHFHLFMRGFQLTAVESLIT